jgi:hypothetical protein
MKITANRYRAYKLVPYGRILFEKWVVALMVKKPHVFYTTWILSTMVKRPHNEPAESSSTPPQMPDFNPISVHVGFVVAMGQVLLAVLPVSSGTISPPWLQAQSLIDLSPMVCELSN